MPKILQRKLTTKSLKKLGVPVVLIAGILVSQSLGWNAKAFEKIKNYYELKTLFPQSGIVAKVEDGDTFELKNGRVIRLIAVDAPTGTVTPAQNYLVEKTMNKKVYLEYDRYQNDKYGRILAWVWVGCEKMPKFLPSDYMHKSNNESNPGLTQSPEGCKNGKLINEELVRRGLVRTTAYADRGPTKYEARIKSFNSPKFP